jgi:histidinol-phosphate aminotransferase
MIKRLARPSILRLKAYESARSLAQGAGAFLDANESPEAPDAGRALNRYPAPQPAELVSRFARMYGVAPQNILIGRGSDEAIDLVTRCFCEPGADHALISSPTYGMYRVAAGIQGCAAVDVPLLRPGGASDLNFALDADGLIERSRAGRGHAKIIYICSPNNPTGTSWDYSAIARVCAEARETSLVVIDEAYAEFARDGGFLAQAQGQPQEGDPFERYPNLVVLRTLSKAWAMAGARVGVAIAHPEAIALMQKARAPYPLAQPCVDLALEALTSAGREATLARAARLVAAREAQASALRALPGVVAVADGDANFLLVRFADSARALAEARARGLVLRDRGSEPGLQNCVRITIGAPAENALALEAAQAAGSAKGRGK